MLKCSPYKENGINENMNILKRYISLPNRKYDYCIVSDCPELIRTLELLYAGFLKYEAVQKYMELQIYQIGNEEYQVSFNGKTDVQNDPIRFVKNILFENPYFDESILALHGAAIGTGEMASLFLGRTCAGKTTLTAYLVNKGFKYITEDCILINYADKLVNPCPLPLHLRDGGKDVLLKNNIAPEYRYINFSSIKRYTFMPQNVETRPTPIGAIYFITRDENRNRVCSLKTEDAFIRLIKSPITWYPLRTPYIQAFKKISSLPCYQLEYSSFSFVEEIMNLHYT